MYMQIQFNSYTFVQVFDVFEVSAMWVNTGLFWKETHRWKDMNENYLMEFSNS